MVEDLVLIRNHNYSRSFGFTLIEILIALVIISLATTALLTSISSSIGQVEHLRDKTEAHFVAQNMINSLQLKLLRMKLANGKMSGTKKMGVQEWSWTITVNTKTLQSLTNIQIFKIKVDVTKKGQKNKVIDSVISYAPIYNK